MPGVSGNGAGIEAGTKIDVDEIETDRLVTDRGFARPRSRNVIGFVLQHFGAAVLMDEDPVGHASFPVSQVVVTVRDNRSVKAAGSVTGASQVAPMQT